MGGLRSLNSIGGHLLYGHGHLLHSGGQLTDLISLGIDHDAGGLAFLLQAGGGLLQGLAVAFDLSHQVGHGAKEAIEFTRQGCQLVAPLDR
ncbi:hypothetical protein D3C81_2032360 [compost metagenome]